MLTKEIIGCLVLSTVVTYLYYHFNKNEEEDINYILYAKVFGLVFVICYIGTSFFKSSEIKGGASSDAFLEQDYSKCVPDLLPKKRFKKSKMKGPSISIDKLKLLDPVSLEQSL